MSPTITGGITLGKNASESDKEKLLAALAEGTLPFRGKASSKVKLAKSDEELPSEESLEKLSKVQLDELAKTKWNVDLDRRKSKKSMIATLLEKLKELFA